MEGEREREEGKSVWGGEWRRFRDRDRKPPGESHRAEPPGPGTSGPPAEQGPFGASRPKRGLFVLFGRKMGLFVLA